AASRRQAIVFVAVKVPVRLICFGVPGLRNWIPLKTPLKKLMVVGSGFSAVFAGFYPFVVLSFAFCYSRSVPHRGQVLFIRDASGRCINVLVDEVFLWILTSNSKSIVKGIGGI